jgi:hypothetical protein
MIFRRHSPQRPKNVPSICPGIEWRVPLAGKHGDPGTAVVFPLHLSRHAGHTPLWTILVSA